MATVSTSQNINAVTYISAEDITITSGAVLTVDAQVPADVTKITTLPGSLICATSGKLRLVNTSTSTPLVLTLSGNTKDFRFEKNGIFEVRGASIDIGTGTGATQAFDFSTAPLNTIPYPSHVEVETGNGTGVYSVWNVVPTAGATVNWATTEISSGYMGNVLFWNVTTRQLSSGNGTNGNTIVSGAKIRIPNIYIHSNSTNATPASRTLIDLSPTGTLDAEWLSMSDRIYCSNSTFGACRVLHCGIAGEFAMTSSNGTFEMDYFSLNPDTTQTTVAQIFNIQGILGTSKISNVSTLTGGLVTGGGKNQIVKLYGLTSNDGTPKIVNCNLKRRTGRSASSDEVLAMQTLPENTVFENLVTGGGRVELTNMADATFINYRHADEIGTSIQTALSTDALVTTNCQRIKFVGGGQAGPGGLRSAILNADDQSNFIEFFNFDYDTNSNGFGFYTGNGVDINFYNCTLRNLRTGALISDPPTSFLASRVNFYNCRATGVGTVGAEAIQAGEFQLIPSQPTLFSTTFTGGTQYGYTNAIDLGLTPTTGTLIVGPFGADSTISLTGTAQLDQSGGVELPTSGDSIEIASRYAIKGVTSFQNASATYTYIQGGVTSTDSTTAPTNMTIEFRLRTPSGTYGSYQTYSGANLSTAIAGLTGYDSDIGFFMQMRFTVSTTDTTRVLYQTYMPTNVDNTYVSPDASVVLAGPNPTDIIKMFLDEGGGPTSDTLLNTFTGGGLHTLSASSYFMQDVYFVRYTSSNETIMSTRSTPQPLVLGSNGEVAMFAGAEVQLAQSADVGVIKSIVESYLDASILGAISSIKGADNKDITQVFNNTPSIDPASVWEYTDRTLTESAGLTTEQAEQLTRVDTTVTTNLDAKVSTVGGGGGGGGTINMQPIQTSIRNSRDSIVQELETKLQEMREEMRKEFSDTNSHIDVAKSDVIDTIEAIEIPETIFEEKEAKKLAKSLKELDKKVTSYIDSELSDKDEYKAIRDEFTRQELEDMKQEKIKHEEKMKMEEEEDKKLLELIKKEFDTQEEQEKEEKRKELEKELEEIEKEKKEKEKELNSLK